MQLPFDYYCIAAGFQPGFRLLSVPLLSIITVDQSMLTHLLTKRPSASANYG